MKNLILFIFIIFVTNIMNSSDLKISNKNIAFELEKVKLKEKQLDAEIEIWRLIKIGEGKKEIEYKLYEISKNYSGKTIIFSQFFNPKKLELKDINNDSINEIIISGSYSSGVWGTDAGETYEVELWFNYKNDKLIDILHKRIKGSLFFGNIEHEFSYNLVDTNSDGFKNFIECFHKIINNEVTMYEGGPDKPPVLIIKESYHWDGTKYIKKVLMRSTVNNLRLREDQSLESKIIRTLKKDEIVEIIDYGVCNKIDDKYSNWLKVKTNDNQIGWAFGLYLESFFDK